jgi:hypothetical protein
MGDWGSTPLDGGMPRRPQIKVYTTFPSYEKKKHINKASDIMFVYKKRYPICNF